MQAIMLMIVIALAAGTVSAQEPLPGLRYWQLRREIRQSFQKRDYDAALRLLNEADKAVPDSPDLIFRMAQAEAFLHHEEASIAHLQRLTGMRVYYDLAQEPAFAELKPRADFLALTKTMESLRTERRSSATIAFRLSSTTFFPEGIAYDSRTNAYFVSSVRQRKIVRVSAQKVVTDFVGPGQDGLWGVSGIGVDERRRLLWACSNATETVEGYTPADQNNAAVFAFNLDDGKLVTKYPLAQPGSNHMCDGLVVGSDGAVFVADSLGTAIYRIDPGARDLKVVLGPEAGISPQGLALSAKGNTLFVSNYFSGLYAIALPSNRVSRVVSLAKPSLAGIDGLIGYGKDLIAIQNGIQPNRVVRLKLNSAGTTVTSVQLLEVNHPLFGEPTLGLVKGHTLLFVANNPITQFLKDRQLEGLPSPVILRRELR
jgi:hypothetical protein